MTGEKTELYKNVIKLMENEDVRSNGNATRVVKKCIQTSEVTIAHFLYFLAE